MPDQRPHTNPAPLPGSAERDAGFTLIEVLVALAVLSLALTSIFQLFSANLRGISAADEYAAAVVAAESKMREILDSDKLEEKSWDETTDNGYRIEASITRTAEDKTENLPVRLLEIRLTVSWSDSIKERSLTLKTAKLVNREI